MIVYLIQHGEATTDEQDPARPLNAAGRDQIEASAKAAALLGIKPTVVLCSTKTRARQTADIMAESMEFPQEEIRETDTLKPTAPADTAVEYLASFSDDDIVLIAGHLPSLARIAAALLTPGSEISVQIENGGLMCIDAARIPPETDLGATLMSYLPPQVLKTISQQ